LKLFDEFITRGTYLVAPRRGAWIETSPWYHSFVCFVVAPRRGAWIETTHADCTISVGNGSHPAGVRGLKPA